jgi:hypothetical protein
MQVHMTATCVVQLPPANPLLPQLQMAAANAANSLLHTALMQQQDAALLQLLVESHELNQLFVQLAAAALGADINSSSSGGGGEARMPAPTAAECEVTQLAAVVSKQLALNSSSSSSSAGDTAAAGTMLVGSVTAEDQLAAALLWHQHQQLLCLSGVLPDSLTSAIGQGVSSSSRVLPVEKAFLQSSSSSHMQAAAAAAAQGDAAAPSRSSSEIRVAEGAVYGLSAAQLLVLSQGCGGGLLQLLLLDSVRLLLLQHTAKQHRYVSSMQVDDNSRQQQQQWCWREVLAVLQNAVATAGTSSNSLLAEAAVGCLASLYTAAAADMHAAVAAAAAAADETTDDEDENHHSNTAAAAAGIASTCAGWFVASSAWNKQVLETLLQRMCQRAVELRTAAQQAQQMAAAGGQSCGQTGQTGQTSGMCSWLADVDCQQQCQAWCCDAQLLLNYMQLVHAADCVKQADMAAGGDGLTGNSSSSRQQSELMSGLQEVLAPLVEQQQLVPFLCWAAARSSWVDDAAAAASSHANTPQQQLWEQQQQWQLNGGYGQQQQQRLGMSAAAAAACCLQLSLSKVSLQLLAALLHSGCVARQLPWLQQQLQQQLWAVSQQQQQGTASFPGSAAASAAAGGNACLVQQLLAAGGLQALSAVEVVDGLAVGLLRPSVVQLLLLPAAISSPANDTGSMYHGVGGDVGSRVLGVVDCQALLSAVADNIKQQQQQQHC